MGFNVSFGVCCAIAPASKTLGDSLVLSDRGVYELMKAALRTAHLLVSDTRTIVSGAVGQG